MSKALAIIGNGLGNLIEQSVVPIVATGFHQIVDIWTPCSSPVFTDVLTGIPHVAKIYQNHQTPSGMYDTVYTSWLMRKADEKVASRQVITVPQPTAANKLGEADYFISRMFPGAQTPAAYCAVTLPEVMPPSGSVNIAFCTGSQKGEWEIKRYQQFESVVAALAQRIPNAFFYLLGIDSDSPIKHSRVIDLRGKYTLLETIGVLSKCDLLISNDSGLAHAAAARKVPTLVVFGPTQVAKNLPAGATAICLQLPCQPCQYRSHKLGIHPITKKKCGIECLKQLHPDDIAAQAMLLMRNKLAAVAV